MNAPALSDAFVATLDLHDDIRPARLIGVEHEYRLSSRGRLIDFRSLVHHLPLDGRRIDPTDPNAYRLRSGIVVTADGREAEIAIPPVFGRPGFTRAISAWAQHARTTLRLVLRDDAAIIGHSTHISVAMPDRLNARLARLYCSTFAPALMLLMDRRTSPGMLVRPRPGRLELGGEYVDGRQLRAAAVFAAGSARALASFADGAAVMLPPPIRVRVAKAVERYGWYVDRRAFGGDLYAAGRRFCFLRASGGRITAQEHLLAAWESARTALGDSADATDLEAADGFVRGRFPLPLEGRLDLADVPLPRIRPTPFGATLTHRERTAFAVSAAFGTWDFTVFSVAQADRRVYASVPRAALASFLRSLDAGRLDAILADYLRSAPQGRVLHTHAQAVAGGLFDGFGRPRALAAPEREAEGVGAPRISGAVAPDDAAAERPGKRRPPADSPEGEPGGFPLLRIGVLALGLLALLAIIALALRPSTPPGSAATGSPAVTAATSTKGKATYAISGYATVSGTTSNVDCVQGQLGAVITVALPEKVNGTGVHILVSEHAIGSGTPDVSVSVIITSGGPVSAFGTPSRIDLNGAAADTPLRDALKNDTPVVGHLVLEVSCK